MKMTTRKMGSAHSFGGLSIGGTPSATLACCCLSIRKRKRGRRVVGLFFPAVFCEGIEMVWVLWLLCAVILCLVEMTMVSFWVSFAARSIRLDDKVVKAEIWDTTSQERFGSTFSIAEPLERGLAEDIENVYKLQCSFLQCRLTG
ncbi:hypothetical protein DVH24_004323 [Malus domestica]|uniref:Uncharacterized protein n=1 Tax=Malus domestica TaxID=3750 RepID=A0A498K831_MALDO|nr:hypothetical protein DVH24_004323 [Malus domestica]